MNMFMIYVFPKYLLKHHCQNCSGRHYPCISSSFCVFFSPRPLSSFYLVQLEVSQTYKKCFNVRLKIMTSLPLV